MPASFQEILNSRLFKFIVGGNVDSSPTEFLVHEEAIAQLSKPLYNLMKGGMQESQTGSAIWADVSKETFEKFAQFAYTSDYSIPKMGKRNRTPMQEEVMSDHTSSNSFERMRRRLTKTKADPDFGLEELLLEPAKSWGTDSKEAEEPEREEVHDYYISERERPPSRDESPIRMRVPVPPLAPPPPSSPPVFPSPPLKPSPITRRGKYPKPYFPGYSDDFRFLTFPLLAPRNNHDKMCEPAALFDPDQSYTEAFLSHASLYILGDLRLIDSLKALALYKLHKTLRIFQLDDTNARDIIALASYIYSEEGGGGGLDGAIGGVRKLVCQYMATNAVVLGFSEGFMDLLGEGGQFVKDFFKYELQRIG
ncbi:hypothetical protein N431DRAFT_477966 [Stipitochalara longipes BDJ]|nr:hypothetical protein N431DRAFT_477966 [Stipitochalara longipes BDJ]